MDACAPSLTSRIETQEISGDSSMAADDFKIKNEVLAILASEKIKNMRVDVFSGYVFLAGNAPDHKSRNDITLMVTEVEGVVSVRNKIKNIPGKKFKYKHEKFFFNPNI